MKTRVRPLVVGLLIVASVLTAFVLSLMLGRYPLSPGDVVRMLVRHSDTDPVAQAVFWRIRFPRALFVLLAGGALGIAGAAMQGIFRNPLASPDIIGISSSASLGAAIAIVLNMFWLIPYFAFAGGLLCVLAVFRISALSRHRSVVSLILSGIVIGALAQAGIALMKYLADPYSQLPKLEYWTMGSFSSVTWEKILLFLPPFLIGTVVLVVLRWQINLLSLRDDEASAMGVPVRKLRFFLVSAATLLVAGVTSVAGQVAWIGLIAPHLARLLFGANNSRLLPASFFTGAFLVLVSDSAARSLTTSEIPISAITSAIGAVFLAVFMWRAAKRDGNGLI